MGALCNALRKYGGDKKLPYLNPAEQFTVEEGTPAVRRAYLNYAKARNIYEKPLVVPKESDVFGRRLADAPDRAHIWGANSSQQKAQTESEDRFLALLPRFNLFSRSGKDVDKERALRYSPVAPPTKTSSGDLLPRLLGRVAPAKETPVTLRDIQAFGYRSPAEAARSIANANKYRAQHGYMIGGTPYPTISEDMLNVPVFLDPDVPKETGGGMTISGGRFGYLIADPREAASAATVLSHEGGHALADLGKIPAGSYTQPAGQLERDRELIGDERGTVKYGSGTNTGMRQEMEAQASELKPILQRLLGRDIENEHDADEALRLYMNNPGIYGSYPYIDRRKLLMDVKRYEDMRRRLPASAMNKAKTIYKQADFAPGIPTRNTEGSLTALQPGDIVTRILHEHAARRSGKHTDYRLGSPSTGLFSWATKKPIPAPGDRPIRMFRQPMHTWEYGKFQGELKSGYGAGKVWIGGKNDILVTKAEPDKLNFTIADERGQERFSLFRTKDGGWLLSNVTPQAPGMLQGNGKVKYVSVDPEDAEKLIEGGHATSAKIDGAATFAKVLGDKIEAVSYRTRKDKNTLIPYTERLGLYNQEIPPEIKGRELKGEIYAQDKEGKVLPPQELSGLLNMNLGHMLQKNKKTGTRLRIALYAIAGAKTPKETAERLKAILPKLPKDVFTIAPTESDPVRAMRMYQEIKAGRHPMTSEGIVLTPQEGGTPIKAKFTKENDVVIRNVFPAELQGGEPRAGGFEYARPGSDTIIGRVSGGLSHEMAKDMLADPAKYVGRTARVKHQGEFPSGALRAPTLVPGGFLGLHEDIAQE